MKTAQRLMVPAPLSTGKEITVGDGQAHYLINVLRLEAGAEVLLFDGQNGEWRAEIIGLKKKAATLVCHDQVRPQDTVPPLRLMFAPIKGDRLESIVEKATELGVARLCPVITDRTIVRKVRTDKLTARAVEAAEQTGRLSVPLIDVPVALAVLIDSWAAADGLLLFADEAGDAVSVAAVLQEHSGPVSVLIGPEGGFTPVERAQLRAMAQVRAINLGPRILRADTACFAALTLVQSIWGDW